MNASVVALFLIPMITMRLFAEEKRSGTIELLLTSPVRDAEIIVGKWMAAMVMYAGILGFSGRLLAPELLASELRSRPRTLLVHGTEDPLVPYESLAAAETALTDIGVLVETLTCAGIGHSIDENGLRRGGSFLKDVLYEATP